MSHGSEGEGERREEATTVAFIGHGFRDREGWEELSLLPREPAKATCRRCKVPRNRPPSAARSRALWLRWKMAYERSQAEGAPLPLAGQAEGRKRGPNTKMGSGSVAEPTGHPFKHALGGFLCFPARSQKSIAGLRLRACLHMAGIKNTIRHASFQKLCKVVTHDSLDVVHHQIVRITLNINLSISNSSAE
jgi:hypothetical protein